MVNVSIFPELIPFTCFTNFQISGPIPLIWMKDILILMEGKKSNTVNNFCRFSTGFSQSCMVPS